MSAHEADVVIVLLIFLFAILTLYFANSRRRFAIPHGKQVYGDLKAEGRILRSERYGLTGKPDKIMQNRDRIIPYEYKSTDADKPREGHMLQMGVYFIILEENYPDYRVEHGVLKYRNYAFRIENSEELRSEVLQVMDMMRSGLGMPERNHNNPGRCVRCSFRDNCPQRLIK